MDIRQTLYNQLALDYGCTPEEVASKENIFVERKLLEGRRRFKTDDCHLKAACVNGKLIVSARRDTLDYMKESYGDANSAWFFEFKKLDRINREIERFGITIAEVHPFYLPEIPCAEPEKRFETVWYNKEELLCFKGDKRFDEALAFIPEAPDMFAVTAVENGEILGMAGASADSATMWQIGINVTDKGKGRGIGSYLVALARRETERLGAVPYYGTSQSHIKSQRVAANTGFVAAWSEKYTEEIKTI